MPKKGGVPENLKSFQPGHKPTGHKPKGYVSLTTTLKKLIDRKMQLKNPLNKELEKKTVKEWVNIALIARALKGNIPAINQIYERVEGKVAQKLTGDLNLNLSEMTDDELKKLAGRE